MLRDGILSVEKGMNAGLIPQLLERNQTFFSTNCTHRGGFIGNRPSFRKLTLQLPNDVDPTRLLFQGAAYYSPDTGDASIRAQLGGRLFQFTPDPNTANKICAVTEWTIGGDANPADLAKAWLWQSEKWMIVQNGSNNPIFWDDVSARRALSEQVLLGTTNADFTVPAINGTVTISLAAAYAGTVGQNFFIGSGIYQATTPAATDNTKITSLWDVAATPHTTGTPVKINPNILGVRQNTVTYPLLGYQAAGALTIQVPLTAAYTGAIGALMTFAAAWRFQIIAKGTGPAGANTLITIRNLDPIYFSSFTQNAGTKFFYLGTSYPITTVGTLGEDIAGVAPGGTINFILDPAYTGAANQIVYIDNAQYKIEALTPAPPGTTLTIINLSDTEGATVASGAELLSIPELPPGRMGEYGLGRNWLCLPDGLSFMASDIVGGSSGTPDNDFRDAPLRTTENTYLAGGGTFRVPSSGAEITAMRFASTLDVSLGQGPLQVFTKNSVFSCQAPVDRTMWQSLTNPILTQSLIGAGGTSQDSARSVNGDILFRAGDGIRSLILARRDFATWGNVPQSREVESILANDPPELLPFGSEIEFDNRLLITTLPTTGALGTYWSGLIALNFDPISNLNGKSPSIYDGLWTGLNVLKLITGSFNGIKRAFAFCYNAGNQVIELWELLPTSEQNIFDNDNQPMTWSFETAALFNPPTKNPFDLIELVDGEMYFKDIKGMVFVQVWYRPDYASCWVDWHSFPMCANNLSSLDKQRRTRIGLPQPDAKLCDPETNRPYRIGNTFQVRVQITGACKFMGAQFKARLSEQTEFAVPICSEVCDSLITGNPCEPCVAHTCEPFPLVYYNLGRTRRIVNQALSFPGTKNEVSGFYQAAAGAFEYYDPFPAPPASQSYPPLLLNCGACGVVARNIADTDTQADIENKIVDMLGECARCAGDLQFIPNQPSYPIALGDIAAGDEWCNGTAVNTTIPIESTHAPFTVEVVSGALPTGVAESVIGFNVVLSGTPTVNGTFNFSLKIRDWLGNNATKAFTVYVNGIEPPSLPDGDLGTPYSETVSVDGPASGPFTWSVVSGALPDGLTLNASTGEISGTPTVADTFNFTIQATNE